MPVHCEKKGENEYALGIDSGGKVDVASILGELPGTYSAWLISPCFEKTQSWFYMQRMFPPKSMSWTLLED